MRYRTAAIFAGFGLAVALVAGLAGRVPFSTVLLRALAGAAAFGALGLGTVSILERFVPEVFARVRAAEPAPAAAPASDDRHRAARGEPARGGVRRRARGGRRERRGAPRDPRRGPPARGRSERPPTSFRPRTWRLSGRWRRSLSPRTSTPCLASMGSTWGARLPRLGEQPRRGRRRPVPWTLPTRRWPRGR